MKLMNEEKLPKIAINKSTFVKTERPPVTSLRPPKLLIKKPIPRYMQANIAWLSKDKNTESNTLETRSRRSSIYPVRSLMRQKSEVSRIFKDFDFDEASDIEEKVFH